MGPCPLRSHTLIYIQYYIKDLKQTFNEDPLHAFKISNSTEIQNCNESRLKNLVQCEISSFIYFLNLQFFFQFSNFSQI